MSVAAWIKKNTTSLAGKTVAVSGATGGIGQALCRLLASLGASLVLLDRNEARSRALGARLCERFPTLSVSYIRLDMTEMDTVWAAADALEKRPLDFLILNAGAYAVPRFLTKEGYDNVFQINFVAPYSLARRLLPHLRARGGRVIAVGSIAHTYSHSDRTDIDFRTRKKSSLVYGNAKRHLMYALSSLAGEGGVAITHPGITQTNITAHYPKLIYMLIKYPMRVIFMSPRKAALSVLAGLYEGCGEREWIGPRIFSVWGYPKKSRLLSADDDEAAFLAENAAHIYRQLCEKDPFCDPKKGTCR